MCQRGPSGGPQRGGQRKWWGRDLGRLSSRAVPARAAIVSFRLGGTDGVSVEAAKWQWALERLGFGVHRVAGQFLGMPGHDPADADAVVPGLAMGTPSDVPSVEDIDLALGDAELVVVENLLSLPLNLEAARVVTKALDDGDRRVVLHHHDLAWQRPHLRHLDELPPRLPGAVHVTINDLSRRELAARGIPATTIRNHFDLDAPLGDRDRARHDLGLASDALLVLHPTRALPRKNIPGALRFAEQLIGISPGGGPVHYWIPGPAEDGYGPDLERLLEQRDRRLGLLRRSDVPIADAYAACDVVVFPSLWEGFGNPVVESVWARRPLAAARYPALDELLGLGFRFFDVSRPADVVAALGSGDAALFAHNLAVARRHLSLDLLPERLDHLFRTAGWTDW